MIKLTGFGIIFGRQDKGECTCPDQV